MGAGEEAPPGMWKSVKKKWKIRSWNRRRNCWKRMVLTCPWAISCPLLHPLHCPLLHLRLLNNLQSLRHLRHRATSPHFPEWPGDYSGKKRWRIASRADVSALRYPKLVCTFLRVEARTWWLVLGVQNLKDNTRCIYLAHPTSSSETKCGFDTTRIAVPWNSEFLGWGVGASIRQDTAIAQDFHHLLQYRSEVNLPRAVSTPKIDSQVPKRSLL